MRWLFALLSVFRLPRRLHGTQRNPQGDASRCEARSPAQASEALICGQAALPSALRFGLSAARRAGCGPVGIANALLLNGRPVPLASVVAVCEREAAMLGGLLGTNPYAIGRVMARFGQQSAPAQTLAQDGLYVVAVWNKAEHPLAGVHIFAAQVQGGRFTVWNRFDTDTAPRVFDSQKALLQGGKLITAWRLEPH